jgi:hypothetical protein
LIVLGAALGWALWRGRGTKAATEVTTVDPAPLPGGQSPPVTVVPPLGPTVPSTVPSAPPASGSPPPVTAPSMPAPQPPGVYVTVTKYTSTNTPWSSTLWGIWNHYKTTTNWQAIWNHPMNTALRAKRGAAEKIQPADKVFVPGAR